jgi:hypothetical protein
MRDSESPREPLEGRLGFEPTTPSVRGPGLFR